MFLTTNGRPAAGAGTRAGGAKAAIAAPTKSRKGAGTKGAAASA